MLSLLLRTRKISSLLELQRDSEMVGTLEAHSLWEAINGETVARKDRQSLSVMFGALSEDIQTQLNITEMAKETWEILKLMTVGAAGLKKSRLQALKRKFEMLVMDDEETVTDFSGKLSKIITQIRNLGEQTDEEVIGSKFLHDAS
ncbi:uncharacterized protein LOC144707140 [Wolffia australiana]